MCGSVDELSWYSVSNVAGVPCAYSASEVVCRLATTTKSSRLRGECERERVKLGAGDH